MNESKIELGSIVELKSGSPKMTVISDNGEEYKCTWYEPLTSKLFLEIWLPYFSVKVAE